MNSQAIIPLIQGLWAAQNTSFNPFAFVVDTNNAGSANDHFIFPLNSGGTYNFVIDWGDGNTDTITTFNDSALDHTYAAPGIFTVRVRGVLSQVYFNNSGDKEKVIDITRWGDVIVEDFDASFFGCSNLVGSFTDVPTLGSSASLSSAFRDCSLFVGELDNMDTSLVTDMNSAFSNCSVYNKSVINWDVSSVTDMTALFQNCHLFNQSLTSWDVQNVLTMERMFSMSQPDVFNGNISGWTPLACVNFSSMFNGCDVFNININSWNVSAGQNFSAMFANAKIYDQPLNSWSLGNATTISNMFNGTALFDQSLSNWDVSGVLTMVSTFQTASNFDQDLSSWDVTSLTDATSMFNGITLSTINYDALLVGWDAQVLQSSVSFSGGNSLFTKAVSAAETARANMISSDLWTIVDGGPTP